MATYATNLSTFWDTATGATTITAIGTGGAGLGNPETDFFIESTSCLSKAAWTNATKGFIVDALGTTFTVPTDGAIIMFAKYDAAGSLDSKANGGLQIISGSSSSAYTHFYIGGNDTLAFDSWVPYTIDPNTATADNTTGSPSGSERWVGILATLPTTSGPTKGNPIAIDAVRYGRCDLEYTSTACTFSGAEAFANATTRRWGLIAFRNGSYLIQGFHSFGTASASCTFSDSNKVLYFLPSGDNNLTGDSVSTGFNRLEVLNASTSVTWDNVSIAALGTRARGVFVHTAGTVTITNCQFTDMDTFGFLSTATATGTTWRRCNAVTAPASDLRNSSILASTVTAGNGALVYNSATDTDGKLDGMSFTQGAAAHSAIVFGTSVTGDITIRNCDFSGFGSTDDTNGAVFKFLATTGSLNLSLVNCTTDGTFSVDDSAGIAVTVVQDPVTVQVKAALKDGTPVENARVYLKASDGTGPFPYQDAVTSITRATTTATVTTTAIHGLATGDKIIIEGITDKTEDNYSVKTITVTSTTVFTYTTTDSGSTSYTGTITVTFVALNGLTNASGILSATRVYSSAQPVIGWTRKSTSSPYLQEGVLVGSVSSTTGFDGTAVMLSDE